ncbi:MAG: EamA family transporter [Polaromonas sp.]
MNLLFALVAAAAYGVSDFFAGIASRRTQVIHVVLISYPVSLVAVLIAALLVDGSASTHALMLGGATGIALALAIWCFYSALAIGPISIVSVITSVLSAGLPVIYGLLNGELISTTGSIGLIFGIFAILLTSSHGSSKNDKEQKTIISKRVMLLTVGAGFAFALSFILTHQIPPNSGLWPIFSARAAGFGIFVLLGIRKLRSVNVNIRALSLPSIVGLLDALANVTMFYALMAANLSTITVVISLYPVFTIILALIVLKEKISFYQWMGIFMSCISIGLIAYQ